jgi:hypothetical protein
MPKVAERPAKASNNLSVAEFLTLKIDSSDKSQSEIARELGYPNQNIITMFKQGRTKLPIPKVPAVAKALDCDPLHLLKVVLTEYAPDTWAVIEGVMGRNIVTDSEMEVVNVVRQVAGGQEVCPRNDSEREELKTLASKWKTDPSKIIRHH